MKAHTQLRKFFNTVLITTTVLITLSTLTALAQVKKKLETPAKVREFAYVANLGVDSSGSISVYSINLTSGVLTQIAGSPFDNGSHHGSVAVDPQGRFAYAANGGSNNISAYAINQTTGALKQISGSPFAGGNGPWDVTVDPAGRFAYVTNILANSVSAYAINSRTGALTEIAGSPFLTDSGPISVTLDPSGQFAYVANYLAGDISGYSVQLDGVLVPISGSPFATGGEPYTVTVHPSGKFVYSANDGGYVSAYILDHTTGELVPVPGMPFAVGNWAIPVAVDPSGRFAYVGGGAGGTYDDGGYVAGYAIDPTSGGLIPVPGSPFPAGIAPWSVAVDPSDRFVYVTNAFVDSNDVSAYTIDSNTGELTPIPGSPFAVGSNPFSIAIAKIAAPDTTPPVTTLSTKPKLLWPPTGSMMPVTISGTIIDTGSGVNAKSVAYAVKDEYGEVQPSGSIALGPGGRYSFTVPLQASRLGKDLDGRQYTITVRASDNAGNAGLASAVVTVPHDRRH